MVRRLVAQETLLEKVARTFKTLESKNLIEKELVHQDVAKEIVGEIVGKGVEKAIESITEKIVETKLDAVETQEVEISIEEMVENATKMAKYFEEKRTPEGDLKLKEEYLPKSWNSLDVNVRKDYLKRLENITKIKFPYDVEKIAQSKWSALSSEVANYIIEQTYDIKEIGDIGFEAWEKSRLGTINKGIHPASTKDLSFTYEDLESFNKETGKNGLRSNAPTKIFEKWLQSKPKTIVIKQIEKPEPSLEIIKQTENHPLSTKDFTFTYEDVEAFKKETGKDAIRGNDFTKIFQKWIEKRTKRTGIHPLSTKDFTFKYEDIDAFQEEFPDKRAIHNDQITEAFFKWKKEKEISAGKIDLSKELTDEQLKVISSLGGNMLVLAGAGSGKTRTIAYSVYKLINDGIEPRSIMLITFSRKARDEMADRITLVMGYMPQIQIGTFHSIAVTFLKHFPYYVNIKNWEVLSEPSALIDTIIRDMIQEEINSTYGDPNDPYKKVFVSKDKWLGIANSYPTASDTAQIISASVNWDKSIKDIIIWKFPDLEQYISKIEEIKDRYVLQKRNGKKIDFDDMLYLWNKILDQKAVKDYASQSKYIFIDEYQDTNVIQNAIIEKMANLDTTKLVLAVGDDAQSIYAFRGANFKNILHFKDNFHNARVFEIMKNHRSCPEILALANDSISHNINQYKKDMKAVQPAYKRPIYALAKTHEDQIEYIIEQIHALNKSGKKFQDIGILLRVMRGIREEVDYIGEMMLRFMEEKIPYSVRGGEDFFDKAHIKDILAFFKIKYLTNDILADDWLYRISSYISGFAVQSTKWVYNYILQESPQPFPILLNIQQLKKELASRNVEVNRIKNGLENLSRIMIKLNSVTGVNIGEQMENFFLKDKEIYDKFQIIYNKEGDDSFERRVREINALINMAREYDSFEKFYESVVIEKDKAQKEKRERQKKAIARARGEAEEEEEKKDEVIISTVHQAKGLEWNSVFIPHLQDNYFPINFVLQSEHFDEDIEEERRLFYVAITRAKKDLYLTSVLSKSLFVSELNKELYDEIEIPSYAKPEAPAQPQSQSQIPPPSPTPPTIP